MWSTRFLLQPCEMPLPKLSFPFILFLSPVRRFSLAPPVTLCAHLPTGVGKTQFCIGCCVQAVARGHLSDESRASLVSPSVQHFSNSFVGNTAERTKNGVIYIDTELKFDSLRLIEVREYQNYLTLFPTLFLSF